MFTLAVCTLVYCIEYMQEISSVLQWICFANYPIVSIMYHNAHILLVLYFFGISYMELLALMSINDQSDNQSSFDSLCPIFIRNLLQQKSKKLQT